MKLLRKIFVLVLVFVSVVGISNSVQAAPEVVCPAGYTCIPTQCPEGFVCTSPIDQPSDCPKGFVCVANQTTPVTPATSDATLVVDSSSLKLSYESNGNESALSATFNVTINGGSKGVNVYSYEPAVAFNDKVTNSDRWNQRTSRIENISGVATKKDEQGQLMYVVDAGKSVKFLITATTKPSQMFAGAYYASLLSLYVNTGTAARTALNLVSSTNNNKNTNSVIIIGEKSPYIEAISPESISVGQKMEIKGSRLSNIISSNAPVFIDGVAKDIAADGSKDGTTLFFTLPELSLGWHSLQLVDSLTGASNNFGFNVIEDTSCYVFNRNLSFFSRGDDVKKLQEFLIAEKLNIKNVTGYYFLATRAAVYQYQLREGLPTTGAFDVITRAKVNARCDDDAGIIDLSVNPIKSDFVTMQGHPSNDTGVFLFSFKVSAGPNDIYLSSVADDLFDYKIESPNGTTKILGSVIDPKDITGLDSKGYYVIGAEESRTFEFAVNVEKDYKTGFVRAVVSNLHYKTENDLSGGKLRNYDLSSMEGFTSAYYPLRSINENNPPTTPVKSVFVDLVSTDINVFPGVDGSNDKGVFTFKVKILVGTGSNIYLPSVVDDLFDYKIESISGNTRTTATAMPLSNPRPDSRGYYMIEAGNSETLTFTIVAEKTYLSALTRAVVSKLHYKTESDLTNKTSSDYNLSSIKGFISSYQMLRSANNTNPPVIPVQPATTTPKVSVQAYLMSADQDRVGSGFGQSVGISNKNPNDWIFRMFIYSDKQRDISSIEITSNTLGEKWSTSDNHYYPIKVVGKAYENNKYGEIIPSNAGTMLDLFAQPESTPFAGGVITVRFTDGTVATSIIPASQIAQGGTIEQKIVKPTSISIVSPLSGQTLAIGKTYKITWSGNFSGNDIFSITEFDALKGKGILVANITQEQAHCAGAGKGVCSYEWNPSVPSQKYQIAVSDGRVGSQPGYSGWFTILSAIPSPTPTVTPTATPTPSVTPSPSISFSAYLSDANQDAANPNSFVSGKGINGISNDWTWIGKFNLKNMGTTEKIVKSVVVYHLNEGNGEGWSTHSGSSNDLGKNLYPLVIYTQGGEIQTQYNSIPTIRLNKDLNEVQFEAIGQIEINKFSGGRMVVTFTDGTSVSASIAPSSVKAPEPIVPSTSVAPTATPTATPVSRVTPTLSTQKASIFDVIKSLLNF